MAMIHTGEHHRVFRHAHLFCGVGSGAQGFNDANPRVAHLRGRFECAGGIDVDAGAIENFTRLTRTPGTVMDLFDRDQYETWHGRSPPAGWAEVMPEDVYRSFGPQVDVMFTSAPCKGFSGLLSATKSKTDKYQALNRLTVRGVWLALEAYRHDPIPIILFENVPRIMTRGKPLLDEIKELLRAYGYIVNDDTAAIHDCGEIGELAQTRKRYLLIARHPLKIPPFVYQPDKHRLRGVGEVLERLPLPGDLAGGVHHRIPKLQWLTWVRLALVEAGKDWRSLNRLRVEDGMLADYGIVPEFETGKPWRDDVLGVMRWGDTSGTVIGNQRSPLHGKVSIADPRIETEREGSGRLGVRAWEQPSALVQGASRVENGAFSVADIRFGSYPHHGALGVKSYGDPAGLITAACRPANGPHSVADPRPRDANWNDDVLGVRMWGDHTGVIPGRTAPSNGAFSIADVRVDGHAKSVQLGIRTWGMTAPCVKGDMSVGTGPYAVADIRFGKRTPFNNVYRIVRFDETSVAVHSGGGNLADPRAPESPGFKKNKYKVTRYDGPAGSVIGASTTGDGAFAVADIRGGPDPSKLHGKHKVEMWIKPSRAVIAGRENGATAIADPRPNWGVGRHENIMRITPADQPAGTVSGSAHSVTGGHPCVADERVERTNYQTGGHYGVLKWGENALAVSGHACHDNGFNSVAEPRPVHVEQPFELPRPTDKLKCRIIAEDGTWHRPFTTLELGALQSMFDPGEAFGQDPETGLWKTRAGFELIGGSDATVREWIGNAVPSAAARGMAETIGETLLLAWAGEPAFKLDSRAIWVKPLGLALAIDSRQPAYDMDMGVL